MFPESKIYRKNFSKIFNQCENFWLLNHFNLSGYTYIEHCYSSQEEIPTKYDFSYYLFIAVTTSVLIIVGLATLLDMTMNNEGNMDFYKKELPLTNNTKSALLCFSLTRNWCRLTSNPKTDLGKDLRFILSLRYLT